MTGEASGGWRGSVGVGLLGCGWIVELAHLPALLSSRGTKVVAGADPDPARRSWLETRVPGLRARADWEAVVADPAVDAVVIALPSGLHADAACAAFAAGKHVFLEKPLALTVTDGRRVVIAWREAGTVGAVGFNFRRNRSVEQAALALGAGELGPLVAIQGSFQWAADRIEGWRGRPELGGGALVDLLSHHVDLVGLLTGQRILVAQCVVRTVRAPEDTAALTLTTEAGITAQLVASSAAGAPVNRLDLVGTAGVLRVDLLEATPSRVARRPGRGARLTRARDALAALNPARLAAAPGREPSYRAALEAFLESVRSGAPVVPDLRDGLRTLTVIEAASESARAGGQPVSVASDEP